MNQKIKVKRFFLFLFIFFFFNFSTFAQESYFATVLQVCDGDTIWVLINNQKIKLRLIGIDTPEKFQSKKLKREAKACHVNPKYMREFGRIATEYAKKLLHKKEKIKVVIYGYGYYGRALALVYLADGSCYNESIIRDGYACVYERSKELPPEILERFLSLEKEAKEKRRGLWGKDYYLMKCLCEKE